MSAGKKSGETFERREINRAPTKNRAPEKNRGKHLRAGKNSSAGKKSGEPFESREKIRAPETNLGQHLSAGKRAEEEGANRAYLFLLAVSEEARLRHRLQHVWGAHISLINEYRTSKCCCPCGATMSYVFKKRNKFLVLKK